MNEDGHRSAAAEMRRTLTRLVLPDDVRVYTETSFGAAFHLIAAGAERRHGTHKENHQGLARWLREHGDAREADAFAELESIRNGRWYGKQGGGSAANRNAEFLDEIAAWSLAGEGDR